MLRVRWISIFLAILFIFNRASAWEISFVGQGYNPEPNEEITLQIQTDVPLFTMAAGIYIVGDANITGAMCEADCNQYGWDNGWNSDPYIDDANGWVYIQGISWSGDDPNGIVGYIKFRYNGGQVGVCIDQENSSAAAWDGNSYSDVPFTTNVLFFGEPDPNDPNFLNPNDPNDPNIPNDPNDPNDPLAGDVNIINFEDFAVFANNWQQCDTGLECDFDESGCVDFNDLKIFCDYWLESTICGVCKFGFGNGTQNDPYRIRTFDDLCLMMTTGSSAYWRLCNDIDASASSSLDGGAGWTPFTFTGHLDGWGYKISNLYINRPTTDGIGFIYSANAIIENIGLENVSITGNNYVGGLCAFNSGTITNCYVTGTVTGTADYVGGLCGNKGGTITSCYSTCTVTGLRYVGGFCGRHSGTTTNCYYTGSVSGTQVVGGFCGNNFGTITNCYSDSTVTGTTYYTGGFYGYGQADNVTGCYSTGTVNGNDYVGGFCGRNFYGNISCCYSSSTVTGHDTVGGFLGGDDSHYVNQDLSAISACYSTGSVSGHNSVGGFGGDAVDMATINCYSEGTVEGSYNIGGFYGEEGYSTTTNCYSIGSVTGDGSVGGFIGTSSTYHPGTITSCYFRDTAGPDNDLGEPKTITEFTDEDTFINWDFLITWSMCIVVEPEEECTPLRPFLYRNCSYGLQ